MNLGDGLLFELENGKPKLILLNRGENVQKNPLKPRPRLPSVLSSRQPSRLDTRTPRTEEQPVRKDITSNGRSHQSKPGRGGATLKGRGQSVTSSKTQENHSTGKEVKTNAKVKAAKPTNVRLNRKPEEMIKKKAEQKVQPLQENEAYLTNEQLRQILNVVQTNVQSPNTEEKQAECAPEAVLSETKEPEEKREESEPGKVPNKDKRCGGLMSWVEERPSENRAALEAKKAQWKKELDEQVALKQQIQRSAPPRLQAEDDRESLVSVQSSVSYKDLPAAIRSSLRVGEFAPMDEVELTLEQRLEQRRRWIQELDKQREESSERKRLEKLQQRQGDEQHLWASHFDSLQRPTLAPPLCPLAPPSCPSADRGETGLSSRLSQWEDVRGSVETSSSGGRSTRASYVRTMTSLLDPAEIEERERRRLKQLEQQRAIELQVEEKRRRREEEESRRRREEEEEERRLKEERERLERQHERDAQRERNKSPEMESHITDCTKAEPQANTAANQDESSELEVEPAAVNHQRDTAVQTEDVHISESLDPDFCGPGPASGPASGPPSGPASVPASGPIDRAQVLQMLQMLHKGFGADSYESFARTERPKKEEKRPEWNTQRPSRRFVPASQRYPEELQRQRHESRLRRQFQLLSIQRNAANNTHNGNTHRQTHNSTDDTTTNRHKPDVSPSTVDEEQTAPESGPPEEEDGRLSVRGRSPVLCGSPDFLPYVRTDDVFNQRPVERQPSVHTDPTPQLLQKTQRQQEIIRGLAQLRQGLLQKQRELESELSHSHLDNDLRPVSMTTYRREL